jgi:hypothetical protein
MTVMAPFPPSRKNCAYFADKSGPGDRACQESVASRRQRATLIGVQRRRGEHDDEFVTRLPSLSKTPDQFNTIKRTIHLNAGYDDVCFARFTQRIRGVVGLDGVHPARA